MNKRKPKAEAEVLTEAEKDKRIAGCFRKLSQGGDPKLEEFSLAKRFLLTSKPPFLMVKIKTEDNVLDFLLKCLCGNPQNPISWFMRQKEAFAGITDKEVIKKVDYHFRDILNEPLKKKNKNKRPAEQEEEPAPVLSAPNQFQFWEKPSPSRPDPMPVDEAGLATEKPGDISYLKVMLEERKPNREELADDERLDKESTDHIQEFLQRSKDWEESRRQGKYVPREWIRWMVEYIARRKIEQVELRNDPELAQEHEWRARADMYKVLSKLIKEGRLFTATPPDKKA